MAEDDRPRLGAAMDWVRAMTFTPEEQQQITEGIARVIALQKICDVCGERWLPSPTERSCPWCAAQVEQAHSVFLDWAAAWAVDHGDAAWVCEPFLARGRGHAFYARHGVGKSLLLLAVCAELVTTPGDVRVLYFDYELTLDDLLERLEDMGHGPDTDLSRLRYALLPALGPLDKMVGANEFLGVIDAEQAAHPDDHLLVVIDTMSRAVAGEENRSDTYRDFYRLTGLGLKQRGLTWARIDHAGKEAAQGQRGSSAKGDDVDVVWRVEEADNGLVLKREKARMGWVPERVVLNKVEYPLAFTGEAKVWPAGTEEVATLLDKLELPVDISTRGAQKALKGTGSGRRREVVVAAVRYRQEPRGVPTGTTAPDQPGTNGEPREQGGSGTIGSRGSEGVKWGPLGDHPSDLGEPSREPVEPPLPGQMDNRGGVTIGTPPVSSPTSDLDDDDFWPFGKGTG